MYGEMPNWYALTKAISILWMIVFLLFIVAACEDPGIFKRSFQLLFYFRFLASDYGGTRHKYYVVPAFNSWFKRSVCRSHDPAGPVSFYRITDFLTGYECSPCKSQSISSVKNHRKSATFRLPLFIDTGKITLFSQCEFAVISHSDTNSIKLNSKRFSSSCSSSLEYLTSVSCRHSLAESVLFKSLPLLRLISSFHFRLLYIVILM